MHVRNLVHESYSSSDAEQTWTMNMIALPDPGATASRALVIPRAAREIEGACSGVVIAVVGTVARSQVQACGCADARVAAARKAVMCWTVTRGAGQPLESLEVWRSRLRVLGH